MFKPKKKIYFFFCNQTVLFVHNIVFSIIPQILHELYINNFQLCINIIILLWIYYYECSKNILNIFLRLQFDISFLPRIPLGFFFLGGVGFFLAFYQTFDLFKWSQNLCQYCLFKLSLRITWCMIDACNSSALKWHTSVSRETDKQMALTPRTYIFHSGS